MKGQVIHYHKIKCMANNKPVFQSRKIEFIKVDFQVAVLNRDLARNRPACLLDTQLPENKNTFRQVKNSMENVQFLVFGSNNWIFF